MKANLYLKINDFSKTSNEYFKSLSNDEHLHTWLCADTISKIHVVGKSIRQTTKVYKKLQEEKECSTNGKHQRLRNQLQLLYVDCNWILIQRNPRGEKNNCDSHKTGGLLESNWLWLTKGLLFMFVWFKYDNGLGIMSELTLF